MPNAHGSVYANWKVKGILNGLTEVNMITRIGDTIFIVTAFIEVTGVQHKYFRDIWMAIGILMIAKRNIHLHVK